MATDDTRGRQGSGNSMAPSDDPNYPLGQPKVGSGATNPGDSDSTSNDGGAHNDSSGQSASNETNGAGDGSASAETNGNDGGTTASGDTSASGGNNGDSTTGADTADNTGTSAGDDDTSAAAAGSSDTGTTAGDGSATTASGGDTGTTASGGGTSTTDDGSTTTAGGDGDGGGSDQGPAFGLPVIGDLGLDSLGNGLIHDAVADTQSMAGSVVADVRSGGTDMITDLINGTDQLLGNAADHLGLGSVVGDNFVAGTAGNLTGLTGALPGDIGQGLVHDAVVDTQSLTTTVLADAAGSSGNLMTDTVNGAEQLVDNAVNHLGIGDTGTLLSGATGDGPLAAIGIVDGGSPAIDKVLDTTGDGLLSGLGIGQIANVTGGHDADNNPAISATAGSNPGDSGPFVNAQAFGDNSSSSGNLIDLNTGPNGGTSGSSSDIIANAFGGSADGTNPAIDGNLIGTSGQTLANADVITSPDQFHFPVLDGVGADSLSGALGTGAGPAAASLVPDATPVVDLGTNPIVDVNLAGEPHAADTQNPLHTSLAGQLLGAA